MQFSDFFALKTWRLDFRHVWRRNSEAFQLLGVREEGPWHRLPRLLGAATLGDYRLILEPDNSNVALFSCGFNSFLSDLRSARRETEAEHGVTTSVRIPAPVTTVRVRIEGRTQEGTFTHLCSGVLRPSDGCLPSSRVRPILDRFGDCTDFRDALDVALVAEGYSGIEEAAFRKDCSRIADILLSTEPFASHRPRPNFWSVFLPSQDSGITDPARQIFRTTLLDSQFGVLGLQRYLLPKACVALREVASYVPYDVILVVCNEENYGGGGIFGQFASVAAHSSRIDYLVQHEFGHAFGGLADEYYNSPVTYEDIPPNPWEPNVASSLENARAKWGRLQDPTLSLPTRWSKDRHDALRLIANGSNEVDASVARRELKDLLITEPHRGRVGAFEGAMYQSVGFYRPEVDCLMFSGSTARFCGACHAALELGLNDLCHEVHGRTQPE